MGFIAVVLAVGAAALTGLVTLTRANHACRLTLLRQQKDMGVALRKLLDLNSMAQSLRLSRQRAEWALKAALATGSPAVIAGARAHLAQLINSQIRFRKYQLQFHREASRIRRATRDQLIQFDSGLTYAHIQVQSPTSFGFPTRLTPFNSLSPDEVPGPHFSSRQALSATWSVQFSDSVIRGICSSTLKKEGNLWVAHLIEAKS